MKNRFSVLASAVILTFTAAFAQTPNPPAPPAAPASQGRPPLVSAPTPAGPVDPLPPADRKNFTAATPTVETVNAFLKQVWGADSSRIYRVMAIQPTAAPGVERVTVYVASNAPDPKIQVATFYVTPDGRHAIGEGVGVVNFGAKPFADTDALLRARADGATRGDPNKALDLVEFADLQCPHCKDAQSIMDQLVKDFPKAHVVFQLFPLVNIHPSAFKAAAYGICAQKQSNDAFFKYASEVFDQQAALTPATDDSVLTAAAVRAGLDGPATAACAATPATKAAVAGAIKLAEDAGIEETPMLAVNGRLLRITNVSYDFLKQIIQYQATLDGVDSGASAETLAHKPPQPVLSDLPQ